MSKNFLDNTQARMELLGVPNIVGPLPQFDSASRVSMFNHHLSQAMVLNNPEFNKLYTGIEYELGKYTFNKTEREHPCEILAVIPKYTAAINGVRREDCPTFYIITLTIEPNGKRHLDYFQVDRYVMGNNGFGYIPVLENLHRMQPGEYLEPHTVIGHSPNIQGNKYSSGANLNIVYGSFAETVEDAFVISESAAKRLETTQVSQLVINCRQDRRPLNLNGDAEADKFLPDIGSYVRDDGVLCATRPIHWTTILSDTSPEALRELLPLQDYTIDIEPGAKIVDLTFHVNQAKLNNCYNQAELYMRNNTKCWETIWAIYLKYKNACNGLTPEMSKLVTHAIYRLIANGASIPVLENRIRKQMRNFTMEGINRTVVDFLQIEVTYTVPRTVHNGDKLTDFHGAKGVIGRIYPDECMPVDKFGIRADMMIDMNSPVSRNNPGQLYETGINRISEFARRAIKETLETKTPEAAFEVAMDWYGDVNPNYEQLLRERFTTAYQKKAIVKNIVEVGPRIWVPPFLTTLTPKKEDVWHALRNIQKWAKKWKVEPSVITYKIKQVDGSFREFTTRQTFSIGSKMIIRLHKIPEITAPGPAGVNHMGIPTKSTFENKHYPVSTNPYRLGEDEMRLLCMDGDPRWAVRLQNMLANSPVGAGVAVENILLSERPTCIKLMPISNGELMRTSAPLSLFHNTAAVLGVNTKDTLTEPTETADELTEAIWGTLEEETTKRKSKPRKAKDRKIIDLIANLDEDEGLEPEEIDEGETGEDDGGETSGDEGDLEPDLDNPDTDAVEGELDGDTTDEAGEDEDED